MTETSTSQNSPTPGSRPTKRRKASGPNGPWRSLITAKLRSPRVQLGLDAVIIAVTISWLSAWLNFRYPVAQPTENLYPLAIEVPLVFGLLALARRFGVKLRWWAMAILSLFILLCRLFWTADNIAHRFLYRDFRVPLDLHLVKEFFRLLYDTSPARSLAIGYTVLLVGSLIAFVILIFVSLSVVHRRSERASFRWMLAAVVILGCGGLASFEWGGPRLATRLFSQRIGQEVVGYTKLPEERRAARKAIDDVARRIGPGEKLDKLQGNHVLLFFIESYGRTSFVRPKHRQILIPKFEAMSETLKAAGFHVASNFLTSPTFGGYSWFAHGTLNTGFKVVSHLHSSLLNEKDPPAFADYFRDAGYLPIYAAPGTTRPWPGMDDYYGFQRHYFSWEYGYRGPRYAWATMADQFILNHLHRKEVAKSTQPLFVQYALVCSHAPFSDIPKYMDDWSKIGNGSSLHRQGRHKFNVSWDDSEAVGTAYATSIVYEMKVLEGYLTEFIKDDSLIVFMGDHQPNQTVTGSKNLNWSVPVHIASRNPDFVQPFLDRGYVRGMIPTQPLPHVGMERFMEEFLADFSSEPATVNPGVWPGAQKFMEDQKKKVKAKAAPAANAPAASLPGSNKTIANKASATLPR